MNIITSISVILGAATTIAFTSAATCSVCSENGTLAEDYQSNLIPMVGNYSDYEGFSTCAEYDQYLSNITSEDQCFEEKLKWKFDLSFFCCEGETTVETNIDGGCTVCDPGTKVDDPSSIGNFTGGYPLLNTGLTCQYIFDVAPHVKYHDMCKDFKNWYGDNICCNVSKTWSPPPTSSPTEIPTSTAAAHYVAGILFTVVIGAAAALW